MVMDYYEQEQIRQQVDKILKNKKKLFKLIEKYIEYDFMTASKHGGQYLHTTRSKVRAKIKTDDLIKLITEDLGLPLTTNQKLTLKEKGKIINSISEDERSQLKNKEIAKERLFEKIIQILDSLYPKPRITETKEPPLAEEKRIKEKKIRSEIKRLRKRIV
jgi:ribosome-associated protein